MRYKAQDIFVLGGPLQLLFATKLMWIGAASFLKVSYLIKDLNYLLEFPLNIIIPILGIMGIFGIIYRLFIFNFIFALSNLLIYSTITLTFWMHSEFLTVSGGNYFLDIIGSLLLIMVTNKAYKAYKTINEF